MPTAVSNLLYEHGGIKKGHWCLSSGMHSDTYVQVQSLLKQSRLAMHLAGRLRDKVVEHSERLKPTLILSAAMGGPVLGAFLGYEFDCDNVFAERRDGQLVLRRDQFIKAEDRVLIVEDVITTGKTARELSLFVDPAQIIGFAAVVNRGGADFGKYPLFSLLDVKASTWEPGDCPLCKAGEPLEKPGSRGA